MFFMSFTCFTDFDFLKDLVVKNTIIINLQLLNTKKAVRKFKQLFSLLLKGFKPLQKGGGYFQPIFHVS